MKALHLNLLISLMLISFAIVACSGDKNPVIPGPSIPQGEFDVALSNQSVELSNRTPLAIYDAEINLKAGTFTVTPIQRTADYHLPLLNLYPNVLEVTRYGFTPNFWADIKITHPLPNSGIDGFDPRVIAILPAIPGVSMYYPTLDVLANNSVVLNHDGYTKLFDNAGGAIPGNTNPFLAYFKHVEYRRWFSSGTGMTSDTRRWDMDIDGFGGPMQFKLVVDVSLNYPTQPQPIIDNAPEPVQIQAAVGDGLTSSGGSALVEVTLLDWQGESNVECKVESLELFTDTVQLDYLHPGPNPHEYIFSGTISNSLLASPGEYKLLIDAWDTSTNIHIYEEITAIVDDSIPASGNLRWAKSIPGLGNDSGTAITILSDDSFVATGSFYGTTENIVNTFITRYNSNGTRVWIKGTGESGKDSGSGITTLSDDSTVITGGFEGSVIFGPDEPNETILTSSGDEDIFIARFNPDGTLVWAKSAGGSSGDRGEGITTLSDNSTIITGEFGVPYGDTATFGEGEPNQTILTSAGYRDVFIARYNPEGTLVWAKRAGGSNLETGYGITTISDDSIAIIGYFGTPNGGTTIFGEGEPNETILTSAGSYDIFIAKLNPDGSLIWAKHSGGPEHDRGFEIRTLSDNSTVVTGDFALLDGGTATFGEGEPNETILTSKGRSEIFLARYNPDGTLAWAKGAGGPEMDTGNGITTLRNNSLVVTGCFAGTATFGSGEPNETVLSASGWDIFIARYNQDGTLAWVKSAGGTHGDIGSAITTLSDNSLVVTGSFMDSAVFGPGEPNETVLNAYGESTVFIARYEP
jgi:uncharacterized delta-60 repeat protein